MEGYSDDTPGYNINLRKPVRIFAGMMEKDLRQREASLSIRRWREYSLDDLLFMFESEVKNFQRNITRGNLTDHFHAGTLVTDSARVANGAMMIADKLCDLFQYRE